MPTDEGESRPAGERRRRVRLTADAWADAALAAIGEGGLAAVAVEPLAARLGVTKGSFYWHFPNRDALIHAALDRWERVNTDGVIALVEAHADPRSRLEELLRAVVGVSTSASVEIALLADADHPAVAGPTARVTERRIAYVTDLYAALGDDPARARGRAVTAVAMFLGHLQLARAAPDTLPTGDDAWARHLDELVDLLVPPADGPRRSPRRR